MSIDPLTLAGLLGYEGEQATTYAAARLAQTEDREMRAFLRKIGASHFLRRPDGSVLAYDGRRERVVSPPREKYATGPLPVATTTPVSPLNSPVS